jgi:hypothetical protein
MRRATRHRTTIHRAAVVAATAALVLVGCGTRAGGAGSTVSPPTSTPASGNANTPTAASGAPSANTPSPSPSSAGGCVSHAQLTAADSGRTLCLTVGGQLRLTLDGTKERPWSPITATGNVLKPANPGFVILPGDAVAAYDAIAPGTARLTSTRPLCAPATAPGQVSCKGIQQWTVTVRVR